MLLFVYVPRVASVTVVMAIPDRAQDAYDHDISAPYLATHLKRHLVTRRDNLATSEVTILCHMWHM